MRVTIDLMKKSTQVIDLSNVINPRVGDDDLQLPLHIGYGDNLFDMRGKDVEFLSNDPNKKNIYIAGTCNTNTPGDNLYIGDLTFRFPAGTFQADGTYDPDKTMFRIVDKETQKVISSVNVKITVMRNNIEFDFDPDKSSYDSRAETMLQDFHDKGQAMLDEIKDLNNRAKSNVSGDTATTAKEAKQQANTNASNISDMQNEIVGARGRFADMAGREDAQDTAISQKEDRNNANANYVALKQKDAQQDALIANKANQDFVTNYLSQMNLQPEAFENEAGLKAKYPNGNAGIMVTADTGHKWLWIKGAWKDCGIYQSAGIDDQRLESFNRDSYSGNLIDNALLANTDLWQIARSDQKEPVYSCDDHTLALSCSDSQYPAPDKQVETYADYKVIPIGEASIISFGANTRISGIDFSKSDYATLEATFFSDQDKVIASESIPVPNEQDGNFHELVLTKEIPDAATKVRLAVCLYGNGRLEVKQPSAYFQQSLMPSNQIDSLKRLQNTHSNLLVSQPPYTWQAITAMLGKVSYSEMYQGKTVTAIDGTNSSDYNLISSELLPVTAGTKLSLSVVAKVQGKCAVEIYQYDSGGANIKENNLQYALLKSTKFKKTYFNGIQLAANTTSIRIHVVTYPGSVLAVQEIKACIGNAVSDSVLESSYQSQYQDNALAHYPVSSWQPSLTSTDEASVDYDVTYQGRPTTKLAVTELNTSYHSLISPAIPVHEGDKASLKVIAKASFERWNGTGSTAFAEIKQMVGSEVRNTHIAQILFNNSGDFETYTLDNVAIEPDTTAVSVDFGCYNCATINVAKVELKINGVFDDNLEVQHWDPWNPYCSYSNGVAKIETAGLTNSDFSFLQSNPIPVDSSKSLDIHVETDANEDGIRFLEVHEITSIFDTLSNTTDYYFNNSSSRDIKKIALNPETKYVVLRLVVQGNGKLTVHNLHIQYSKDEVSPAGSMVSTTSYDLPHLTLHIKTGITSNYKVAPFAFEDGERKVTGYLQFAIQGDSSALYDKKNLKIKCFSDKDCTKKLKWKPKASWKADSKFNIKANWIDATQARNLVNSKLVRDAISVTPIADSKVAKQLYATQFLGQMEGFPIELYFDDGYYGLMTFNTKKGETVYGLDDDQSEAITLETPQSNLDSADATVDGKNYATVKNDAANDVLKANFTKFLSFLNTANDADFKAQVASYIDIKSVITLYLFGVWSHEWDFTNKSEILLTYNNGQSYYMMPYDLDSTWGLYWQGQSLNEADDPAAPYGSTNSNKLLARIYDNFKPEIKAQWENLRTSVWSNTQAIKAFHSFINSIPQAAYERNAKRWPGIPSQSITDYEQIQNSILNRSQEVDNWIAKF